VTGFLVPPSDAVALADRIERLIRDPALRQRMAEAGPERIATQFNLDTMVAQIESLYTELLAGRPQGRFIAGSG
jgi:glycosyltransferase involved in cell wall biosynthesis